MIWSLPQCRTPELMDDPDIAERDHVEALDALATINAVSRTASQIAAAVQWMSPSLATPLVVIDVACGGGDVTCDLARRLCRITPSACSPARVIGLDRSGRAIDRARRVAAARGIDASFEVRDVLADGLPECDVAVSSLFLHHLDDAAARRLMRAMAEAARRGIVVSDLVRSRVGLALAVVGTTFLSRSRVARVDGPLSVRAARTPDECRELCRSAGLHGAVVTRVWPERLMIRWRKDGPRFGEGAA
ncbi:MAG: methyltransferase domain-containing protein [Planctomycetia bacterium]